MIATSLDYVDDNDCTATSKNRSRILPFSLFTKIIYNYFLLNYDDSKEL